MSILKLGDAVKNRSAFGETVFTIQGFGMREGKVIFKAGNLQGKGGWFTYTGRWTRADGEAFTMPPPEAEATKAPLPSEGNLRRIAPIIAWADEHAIAVSTAEWNSLRERLDKGAARQEQPTEGEDEAYAFGIEEGREQVFTAIGDALRRALRP